MQKRDQREKNNILKRAETRRKLARQVNILRFVSALLIVMTIATFSLSISSFASEREGGSSYKYYTSYTVKDGDNLSRLADEYMTKEYSSAGKYISEVVSINHLLSASDIYAGQVIILPYYSMDLKH